MKIGDYVRFKDKNGSTYIRKIIDLPKDKRYGAIQIDKLANYSDMVSPKNIIGEPKEKPIDLIEVGDYVNGYKIVNRNKCTLYIEDYADEDSCLYISRENIKSIVTKEQFERMEYKIDENN